MHIEPDPPSKGPSMAKVITSVNHTGCVGRSASTINLARAASSQGIRVLVVDFDPKASTTDALAKKPLSRDEPGEIAQLTVGDVIEPRSTIRLEETLLRTVWDNIDLIPSGASLAVAEEMITDLEGRHSRLQQALQPLLEHYDLVLIDSPRSLGLLTIIALTASDEVLVIAHPQQWSGDGMAELSQTVRIVQQHYNCRLTYAGVLINMWQGTTEERATKRNRQVLADIRDYFTEAPVLKPFVPLRTGAGEAVVEGIGLDEWTTVPIRLIAEDYGTHINTLLGA